MKEYDEDKAARLMCEAAGLNPEKDIDTAYEVLDLIYDFFESEGELDINADETDDDSEAAEVAGYIEKVLAKNPPSTPLTDKQILAMVEAETEYQDSLI